MVWGYFAGAVILLALIGMLYVAYRVLRLSSNWWYNATIYARFSRERGDARTETQRLAMGINLLWMGKGDPEALLARFLEWAANDHVRHVAGDRVQGLLETDPWRFFERAAEAVKSGFTEKDERVLEKLGRPIRDELNEIVSDCLIFGEWPFKYWLEHRPSGLEEINIERVKPGEEPKKPPEKPKPKPKPEPKDIVKPEKGPMEIVPMEKQVSRIVPVEDAPAEPVAKPPPDAK